MSDAHEVPVPQGMYASATVHASVAFSAGMTPRVDGILQCTGRVGADVTVSDARLAAGLCVRNALTAIAAAAGGSGNIERCLRMTVYVACSEDFTDHLSVADGASAVITEVLGKAAIPARSAVGVRTLPGGASVEVDLTAVLRNQE